MAGGVFATIICPLFGMILANVMWFSPFPAMQKIRVSRDLGTMNPIPFTAIIANCIGWISYGYFKKDHFIFWSNITGLMVGIYYSLISLTILAPKGPGESFSDLYLTTERLFLAAFFFWGIIGLVCATAFNHFSDVAAQCATLTGTISCCFSIAYYAAPLSSMAKVIAEKDASTLFFPTILINVINGACWFLYGAIGTGDLLLWLPNGLGVLLCASQIALIVLYKKQSLWDTLLGKKPSVNGSGSTKLAKSSSLSRKGSYEAYEDIDEEELIDAAQDTDSERMFSLTTNPMKAPSRSKM